MFEIGNSLREARVRQGVGLPEAEQATKVRGKYLRALEDERFDLLPGHTYIKGFLRAYAEYLGLDGQLYVDEYNSRYVAGEEETPIRARRTAQADPGVLVSRTVVVVLAAIALITALSFAAFQFGGDSGSSPQAGKNPRTAGTSKQHRRRRPHVSKRHSHTRPTAARVVLTGIHGGSWIRVHDRTAGGRSNQLFVGTLETGKSLNFRGKRLLLEIGHPRNVRVKLNGRLSSLPGGNARETLVITPSRIARASAAA